MKQLKMIFGFVIFNIVIISCSKNDNKPSKAYGDFLTVELSPINNSVSDSIYLVRITNSRNEEFEQVCILQYELSDRNTNEYFSSHEDIFNKKIPNSPVLGYLNLQSGGDYNHIVNLNDIYWGDKYFSELKSGEYNLFVNLYIKDPESPDNTVTSDIIMIKK